MDLYEARLAQLARNGDRLAFRELVDLYQNKIYHLAKPLRPLSEILNVDLSNRDESMYRSSS